MFFVTPLKLYNQSFSKDRSHSLWSCGCMTRSSRTKMNWFSLHFVAIQPDFLWIPVLQDHSNQSQGYQQSGSNSALYLCWSRWCKSCPQTPSVSDWPLGPTWCAVPGPSRHLRGTQEQIRQSICEPRHLPASDMEKRFEKPAVLLYLRLQQNISYVHGWSNNRNDMKWHYKCTNIPSPYQPTAPTPLQPP